MRVGVRRLRLPRVMTMIVTCVVVIMLLWRSSFVSLVRWGVVHGPGVVAVIVPCVVVRVLRRVSVVVACVIVIVLVCSAFFDIIVRRGVVHGSSVVAVVVPVSGVSTVIVCI